jgi:NADH dehydrogenase FAD-containing subunit
MTTTPLRVLVAGGGIAGIEALLELRALAGDRVELNARRCAAATSRTAR